MDWKAPGTPENFGARLRYLREKRQVSRRVLADLIGLSRNSVAQYERGERMPDLATAARIADHFGVSLDDLAGRGDWRGRA